MIHQVISPNPQVVYLPFLRRPSSATGQWSVIHEPVRAAPVRTPRAIPQASVPPSATAAGERIRNG